MDAWLSTLAFAALIGAQFLAAIVLISKRKTIYADPRECVQAEPPQPEQRDHEVVEAERPAKAA
jgi:hypothetical protein